jgi:hypothetical protein
VSAYVLDSRRKIRNPDYSRTRNGLDYECVFRRVSHPLTQEEDTGAQGPLLGVSHPLTQEEDTGAQGPLLRVSHPLTQEEDTGAQSPLLRVSHPLTQEEDTGAQGPSWPSCVNPNW